jgi:Sec-independent protein translocase protein TatA
MSFLHGPEILILAGVLVLFLGPTLLPRLTRSWIKGVKDVKAVRDETKQDGNR